MNVNSRIKIKRMRKINAAYHRIHIANVDEELKLRGKT